MYHRVYTAMVDLNTPIQRHLEASFSNHEVFYDQLNMQPETDSGLLATSAQGDRAASNNCNIMVQTNEDFHAQDEYVTADESSGEEDSKSEDDSWWYSDAKAPESKYDDWYYLVYLPCMQRENPRPSSRRRYRGLFNPSVRVDSGQLSEVFSRSIDRTNSYDNDNSGDQSIRIQDSYQQQQPYKLEGFGWDEKRDSSPELSPRLENNNVEVEVDVDWENFESHGSERGSSPELTPRSIPLEWDDFDEPYEPNLEKQITWEADFVREEDDHLDHEMIPHECLEYKILDEIHLRNGTHHIDIGTQVDEEAFDTCYTPEPEPLQIPFSSPIYYTANCSQISPESYYQLIVSHVQQPHATVVESESSARSLTDELKSEMEELSSPYLELRYFDMPWVNSQMQELTISSDIEGENELNDNQNHW